MVSKEQYDQGLHCRGICYICHEKLGCYQYQMAYPNLSVPTEKTEIKVVDEVNAFIQKLACFGCPLICTSYQFNMEDKDCVRNENELAWAFTIFNTDNEYFEMELNMRLGEMLKNLCPESEDSND